MRQTLCDLRWRLDFSPLPAWSCGSCPQTDRASSAWRSGRRPAATGPVGSEPRGGGSASGQRGTGSLTPRRTGNPKRVKQSAGNKNFNRKIKEIKDLYSWSLAGRSSRSPRVTPVYRSTTGVWRTNRSVHTLLRITPAAAVPSVFAFQIRTPGKNN